MIVIQDSMSDPLISSFILVRRFYRRPQGGVHHRIRLDYPNGCDTRYFLRPPNFLFPPGPAILPPISGRLTWTSPDTHRITKWLWSKIVSQTLKTLFFNFSLSETPPRTTIFQFPPGPAILPPISGRCTWTSPDTHRITKWLWSKIVSQTPKTPFFFQFQSFRPP